MKTKSVILFVLTLLSAIIFFTNISTAQTQRANDKQEWTGSTEQKVYGLMTVWSEAKYSFPWFDKLPDLDWDSKVTEYIPRVIAAQDVDSYIEALMKKGDNEGAIENYKKSLKLNPKNKNGEEMLKSLKDNL
jgi:hypothetical protein